MSLRQRILGAVGIVILGGFVMVFIGTEVTSCLGPLGRTLVQSIKDGCVKPGVGITLPIGVLWFGAAALLLLPVPRSQRRRAAIGAILGVVIAAFPAVILPPTTMTGATSYGDVITVELPFDWNLLLAAVVAGATLGAIVGSRLARSRPVSIRA